MDGQGVGVDGVNVIDISLLLRHAAVVVGIGPT